MSHLHLPGLVMFAVHPVEYFQYHILWLFFDDVASIVEVNNLMINMSNFSTDDINFASQLTRLHWLKVVLQKQMTIKQVFVFLRKTPKTGKRKRWWKMKKIIIKIKPADENVFYHHSCELLYLNNYNKIVVNNSRTS